MITLLLRHATSETARWFSRRSLAKSITAGLFLLVFGALVYGIYRFFESGFYFIARDEYLANALRLYVYEIFLLIVGALVFVSTAISGLVGLFRGSTDAWMMASPRFRAVPAMKAARVFMSSLWPFFIIALPALLAVRTVFGYPPFAVALGMLGVVLLVALASALALTTLLLSAASLLLLETSLGRKLLTFGNTAVLTLLLVAAMGSLAWSLIAGGDILDLFRTAETGIGTADPGAIREAFSLFPSHLAAQALFDLGANHAASAVGSLAMLAVLFLGAAGFALVLISRFYLPVWQALQEGRFRAGALESKKGLALAAPVRFPRYFPTQTGAIFEKEGIAFSRSPRNALWLVFMLALWLAQTGLAVFLRANLLRHRAELTNVAQILETMFVVVAVYFMASFTLRFAFPALSAERRTAWILGSAPLDMGRVYRAKFLFFAALFSGIGVTVAVVNVAILEFPLRDAALFFLLVETAVLFVTALGLALGAWFPNFETDDPEVLSTSLPGLGFTAGALGYGALGAYLLYQYLGGGSLAPLGAFEIFSLAGIALLFILPAASLRNLEFGATNA